MNRAEMTSRPKALFSSVNEKIKIYQSAGRALLFTLANSNDVEVEADGSWVQGASGRRYLDLGSFGVFLLGHRNPYVTKAVINQLHRLPLSSRSFPEETNAEAAELLAEVVPGSLSKVLFCTSGAEAVEAAIKLCRISTGRPGIVCLDGAYHGKTLGALSLTDNPAYRTTFEPLLPNVYRVSRTDASDAVLMIETVRPAGVVIEPIQGEGGIFELDPAYLRQVRSACDKVGSLLVFDEIQCGLGRTGTWWASQASGVQPDVLLVGKSLGGGVVPAAALVATPDAFRPFDRDPLLHTSTFAGNPLACAAAAATIRVISSSQLWLTAERLGDQLRAMLEALSGRYPDLFTRVTGRGLMLGLHCANGEASGLFLRACFASCLILTPCLTAPTVIRFTPPATLQPEELQFADKALDSAANDVRIEIDNHSEED